MTKVTAAAWVLSSIAATTIAPKGVLTTAAVLEERAGDQWPFYGGDQAGTKYSPLTDVNRSTVSRLRIVWEWSVGEKALEAFGTRPGNFQATPLMINDVVYLSTPY